MNKELMEKVLQLEWEMFSSVRNFGRRASCQLDGKTFRIVRYSQECDWPEELLASYYEDLAAARRDGRNLMTEKYAWMMESTFPAEFAELVGQLPAIDSATLESIEEIVSVNVDWKLAICDRYPKLSSRGRAIRSSEDSSFETSFETYLRGELKTCSPRTIALLREFTLGRKTEGVNGAERDLLNQVRQYGFATLEQAEASQ